ncbi:MAG: hypothetical protein IKP28_04975 [Clostridia bacterium]|nr:hypothetical protein [Clostridia bacterium]
MFFFRKPGEEKGTPNDRWPAVKAAMEGGFECVAENSLSVLRDKMMAEEAGVMGHLNVVVSRDTDNTVVFSIGFNHDSNYHVFTVLYDIYLAKFGLRI